MNEIQDRQAVARPICGQANLRIQIPEMLLKRVNTFCGKHEIDLYEFFIDAITEKLELSHRERRKRPRI
jgi:hypothetical protein